jgi:hypothetical protein
LGAVEADGGGDGGLFRADGETVGGVFDVAAGDDSTVGEQDGGAYSKVAVGCVGVVGDSDGALLQVRGLGGRERCGKAWRIVIRLGIRVGVWFVVLVGLRRHDVSEATGCGGR